MELERVGSIAVSGVAVEVLGKVDNGDGLEGAFLAR